MKIFYDIPYMKGIVKYVLVPVIIIIIIAGLFLFIYSKKHKDHDAPQYNFVMDFWSSLIGIIVTGAILAIAVGFSFAMTEKMQEYGLVEEKKTLYYLLKYFIVLPFVFVVLYIIKFLKTIYYKPHKQKKDSSLSVTEQVADSTSIPPSTILTDSVGEAQKDILPSSNLPSMEQTIQDEMREFELKKSSTPVEEKDEIEVISLEDE